MLMERVETHEPTEYEIGVLSIDTYLQLWPKIREQLETVPHIWEPWFTLEFLRTCQAYNYGVWGVKRAGKLRLVIYTYVTEFLDKSIFRIPLIFGNEVDGAIPVVEAMFEKIASGL